MARKFVLSAAHCVENAPLEFKPEETEVRIGVHRLDKTFDDGEIYNRFINVKKITPHPNYDRYAFDYYYYAFDIVILELEGSIDIEKYTPACLPLFSEGNKFDGKLITSVGWGKTSVKQKERHQNEPYKVETTIARPDECPFSSLDPSIICSGVLEIPVPARSSLAPTPRVLRKGSSIDEDTTHILQVASNRSFSWPHNIARLNPWLSRGSEKCLLPELSSRTCSELDWHTCDSGA